MDKFLPKEIVLVEKGITEKGIMEKDITRELLGIIGEGTYSDVYDVRYKNNTDQNNTDIYALKHMENEDYCLEVLKTEVSNQIKAAEYGLAPKIIESWTYKNGAVIIMEKLDITVADLFHELNRFYGSDHDQNFYFYGSDHGQNFCSSKSTRNKKKMIIRKTLQLIYRLHQQGIYHGDLHCENIMVKLLPTSKIYAIDFASAIIESNFDKPNDKTKPSKNNLEDEIIAFINTIPGRYTTDNTKLIRKEIDRFSTINSITFGGNLFS